jgi:nitrogen fixation/metabolism regulation signal transduction histidine kinase
VLELYEDGPVVVTADLDPALPPVLGDAGQIRQVLHNLIKNAGEAMVETVGTTRHADNHGAAAITVATRSGRMATLLVTDRGPGFPPQILARAFEPYVTTKTKGTGLGLAIVRKIVDDHGGTVRLANRTNEQGGGAEVSMQLPLHQPSRRDGTAA